MINKLRTAIVAAFIAGLVVLPETANATPATGVSGTILAQVTINGKDYIVRRITIQPGGSTGWHYHDGTLYAKVERGTLSRTFADCHTTQISRPGDTLVEQSGPRHVHLGRNLGSTAVVLLVLYVDPAGSPLSEDAANPGCGFQ